jgi:hypothetical protein
MVSTFSPTARPDAPFSTRTRQPFSRPSLPVRSSHTRRRPPGGVRHQSFEPVMTQPFPLLFRLCRHAREFRTASVSVQPARRMSSAAIPGSIRLLRLDPSTGDPSRRPCRRHGRQYTAGQPFHHPRPHALADESAFLKKSRNIPPPQLPEPGPEDLRNLSSRRNPAPPRRCDLCLQRPSIPPAGLSAHWSFVIDHILHLPHIIMKRRRSCA